MKTPRPMGLTMTNDEPNSASPAPDSGTAGEQPVLPAPDWEGVVANIAAALNDLKQPARTSLHADGVETPFCNQLATLIDTQPSEGGLPPRPFGGGPDFADWPAEPSPADSAGAFQEDVPDPISEVHQTAKRSASWTFVDEEAAEVRRRRAFIGGVVGAVAIGGVALTFLQGPENPSPAT